MNEISRRHRKVRSSSPEEDTPPLAPAVRVCHRIIFALLVGLLAVVPLVPAPWEPWARNGMLCVIALMVLLWIVSQFFGYETYLVSTLLNAPMLLLATYAIIRYGLSDVEWVARREVLLLVGMVFLFFVVTNVVRHRWQFPWLIWTVVGVGVLLALEGLGQLFSSQWSDMVARGGGQTVRSTFAETADHVAYLHMAFGVAAATFLFSRRPLTEKILCAFAALLLLVGMAVTGQLAHWFSWLASAAVLGVYLLRRRGWKFHRVLVGAALAFAVAIIAWLAVTRLEGVAPPQPMSTETTSTTTVPLWRSAVNMAVRNPLLGLGPGMFPWRYPEFRGQQGTPSGAGSDFFTFLAEYGVVGALLVLSAVVGFCVAAIQILNARAKRYSASTPSNRYAFVVGALAIVAAALVDMISSSGFDACANQLTLVTILAAGLTCGLHNRNEHPDKTHIAGKHTVFRLTSIHRVMLTGGSLMGFGLFAWLLVNTVPSAIFTARAAQCASQRDYDTAERMYQRALRSDERNFAAVVGLADLYVARNEPDDLRHAMSLYERALVLNPYAHELHIRIARLYDAAGNRQQAADQIQLAIQADQRNAAYHIVRAQHHLRWKENQLAEAAFRRAATLDPAAVAAATNAPTGESDSSDGGSPSPPQKNTPPQDTPNEPAVCPRADSDRSL